MDSREETGRRINMYRSDFTWSEQHTDTERELNVFSESQMRTSHLQFPPGVELLQALDCLLSVHHGGHCRALLWGDRE